MRRSLMARTLAVAVTACLALAACGGGGNPLNNGGSGGSSGGGGSSPTIVVGSANFTENQILAFLGSLLLCFGLWVVGEEMVIHVLPQSLIDVGQSIGTGARFRSIGRGVLDLRDLVYYASIVVVMLHLNRSALEARKD